MLAGFSFKTPIGTVTLLLLTNIIFRMSISALALQAAISLIK